MCFIGLHDACPVDNYQQQDVDQDDNRRRNVTLEDLSSRQRLNPVKFKDVRFVSGLDVRKDYRWWWDEDDNHKTENKEGEAANEEQPTATPHILP